MTTLTLKEIETPTGVMRLGATKDALVLCDWPDAPGAPHCFKALCKRLGAVPTTGDSPVLEKAVKALEDYFAGRLQTFDLPLRPCGTPFQEAVWRALLEVPYGKTASYGDIARRIGRPTAFRAVAQAVGANPLCIAATASSARTERSRASGAVSTEKSSCSSSKAITAFDFS